MRGDGVLGIMKRFTETNKWTDPWFRRLSGSAKLLWFYLTDNCNAIGLIDLDFAFVSNDCGQPIEEKHLAELGDRVQLLDGKKVFIPRFIGFQYGELSPNCLPHKTILKLAALHKITQHGPHYYYPSSALLEPLRVNPSDTLLAPFSYPQEKTRKEKTGKEEGVQGETDRLALVAELHRIWQERTGFEAKQMTYERMWVDFLDAGHRKADLELVIERSKVLNNDRDAKYHAPLELGRLISDLTKFSDRLMAAKAWVKAGRPLESRKESNEETPRVIPKSEWVRNAL